MSEANLTLEVATPVGLALSTDCEAVSAPSVEGEFGVFPGHLPLLAAVRAGVVTYELNGKKHAVAVGPGFVEAEPDRVILLTDAFATPDDVDVAAVNQALAEAEKALDALETAHVGHAYEEIRRDIEWAHAQLAIKGGEQH